MSTQITTVMVDAFSANVIQIAQEVGSQLENTVLNDPRTGEKASRDRLGTVDLVQRAGRHSDTPFTEIPHTRRWATPVPWEGSDMIDESDEASIIAVLDNDYAVALGMAAGRRQDLIILQAANGTAITGRDGSGTQVLPTGQKIVVANHDRDSGSGDVGLTVGKLIVAKKIFVNGGVNSRDPMDELHIAVNGTQLSNMLAETEVASADYNKVKALVDGDVEYFMGFKFHEFADGVLATDGSSDELVICWAKSGIWLNEPIPKKVEVAELPGKSYSTQVFIRIKSSAVRLDDAKVIQIACDPS